MTRGVFRGHKRFMQRLAYNLATVVGVVIVGGFASAALVRYSPGYGLDPSRFNPGLRAETIQAMENRRGPELPLPIFYVRYLLAAGHGDFGLAESLHDQPIAGLLRERIKPTAWLIGWGTAGGCLLAGLLASCAVWSAHPAVPVATASVSGLLLAIPPAVLGLAFFFLQAPLALVIALALVPRLYGTLIAILQDVNVSPMLIAARARGVGPIVIGFRYIAGAAASRLTALLGIAVVIAFGTAVPVEALCDVPGLGQLAWHAATARDLPLLCALALIITSGVTLLHAMGDILNAGLGGERA